MSVDAFANGPNELAISPTADTRLRIRGDVANAKHTGKIFLTYVDPGRRRIAIHAGSASTDRLYGRTAVQGPVTL